MVWYNLGHVVGNDGAKGDPGEKGDKGDKGDPGTITIDTSLSTNSTNAVQNKAIAIAVNNKANSTHSHSISDVTNLQTTLDDLDTRIGDAIDYINL